MQSHRRSRSRLVRSASALALAFVLASPLAFSQDGTGAPPAPTEGETETKPADPPPLGDRQGTVGREGMWRAPTEEDWAKPVLMEWERTWEDAVAVAQQEQRAILCCINMDGEIASEHYAGVRYRQPEVAELYEPYVKVIASVYRHTPRDYDEDGNRIECPRFGGVTCGEHIAIEPILFEKFLNGDRVAPRHIMVELDGSEVFDLYYINDTASVFDAIREGIQNRTTEPKPIVRGDRPMVERVASRAVEDRRAVERAYKQGTADERRALLEAAAKTPETAPTELLRLAIFGLDPDLAEAGRKALAQTQSKQATDLLVDALQVPMQADQREELLAALERLGATSRRAKWLASVQRGLTGGGASKVDPGTWIEALRKAPARAEAGYERSSVEQTRNRVAEEVKERPEDALARLELAEATLDLARLQLPGQGVESKEDRAFHQLMLYDAKQAALAAERLGAEHWKVDGVIAMATYYEGDAETAHARAEKAVQTMPPGEAGWTAMAVLTLFGEAKFKAIKDAVQAKEQWKPEWLTDLHAAYTVLLQHPEASEEQVLWYYDFLVWLRARRKASIYLARAVERFPDSSELHNKFRGWQLRMRGPGGLEQAYDEVAANADSEHLPWFRAYASLTAAESWRRMRRLDESLAAYARAAEGFSGWAKANPDQRVRGDHYVALIHAAQSRLAYQREDWDTSLAEILASIELRPDSAGTRDGIGVTPGETAQMLRAKLDELGRVEDVAILDAALDTVDPELLRYDRP